MSDQRLKGLAALVGIALLGVIVTGALVGSASAADDLQPEAVKALKAAGLDGIDVDFDGREAVLAGGPAADLGKAELVVEGLRGVRSASVVRTEVEQGPAPTVPTFALRRTGDAIAISGTVPDSDAAADLKADAAEAFGVPITGDLRIDPAVGSATWLRALPGALSDLAGVNRLVLRIDGGTATLEGATGDRADLERIGSALGGALPGLRLHIDIVVEES